MTTFNTGNPIGSKGSSDPRDLYDNSENLDVFVNDKTKDTYPDRLGAPRKTWRGMESEFNEAQADRERQYQQVILEYGNVPLGDYEAGIEVTGYNQTIRDCAGGTCVFYRAAVGTELPYTTTGIGMPEGGAFVDAGDAVLRGELLSDSGPLNISKVQASFGSAIEMKAASWLDVGRKVFWAGYYEESDGGSNWGVVESGAHTEDGVSVFSLGPSKYVRANIKQGKINIKKAGAMVDGITSDSAACQRILKLQKGLYFPDGDCLLSEKLIAGGYDLEIDSGPQSRVFTSVGVGGGFMDFTGGSLVKITEGVSLAVAEGDTSITTSRSGLKAGDKLIIHDPTSGSYNPGRGYYTKGEILTVSGVGVGLVEVSKGTYDSYPVTSNLYEYKTKNISIGRLNLRGAGGEIATADAFKITFATADIDRLSLVDASNYSGLSFDRCHDVSISRSTSRMASGDGSADVYPLVIFNCEDFSVQVTAESTWHAVSVGGGTKAGGIVNRGIHIRNSVCKSTKSDFAIDFHGNTERSSYKNCTVFGGVTLGANLNEFTGNTFKVRGGGRFIYGTELIGYGHRINDNNFYMDGDSSDDDIIQAFISTGVVAAKPGALILQNNIMRIAGNLTSRWARIHSRAAIMPEDSGIDFIGNKLKVGGTASGDFYIDNASGKPVDSVVIRGNQIVGSFAVAGAGSLSVGDNTYYPSRTGNAHLLKYSGISGSIKDDGIELSFGSDDTWTDCVTWVNSSTNWSCAVISLELVNTARASVNPPNFGTVDYAVSGHSATTTVNSKKEHLFTGTADAYCRAQSGSVQLKATTVQPIYGSVKVRVAARPTSMYLNTVTYHNMSS